ncbi:helix-turn-helix domain-containing protein [Salipiger sp. PrR007]|uniref:helix-turn-helix domain-containing protein n=1 Tax=Salipiger sp. PrR007 TaxID=2706884 RepID=UPI0013B96277|nr:helix-turn-helix domain-containing protein [Salipiger sp. PrR007]NDW30795.1 helix-turn-helix domain-containing protein [Salipiger sp. PrR007]
MSVQLAVKDTNAARMLDMPAAKFRALVDAGALPPPVVIGDMKRWRVDQIEAILKGNAALPKEEFEL